jgi:triacylglycerol lipase
MMTTLSSAVLFCMLLPALAAAAIAVPVAPSAPPPSGDYVVLLHGLGRTRCAMWLLGRRLRREGYQVINVGYPSRHKTIEALTADLAAVVESACTDPRRRVHFVGHSFGGILARCYLQGPHRIHAGRVVMLAPPNRGSEVVDRLRRFAWFRAAVGPVGLTLGTDAGAVPRRLAPPAVDVGIIAGDRTVNPIFSRIIPGPDDGKVSVASARMAGMRDFAILHASHTFMMQRRDTAALVTAFLRHGRFRPRSGALPTPLP